MQRTFRMPRSWMELPIEHNFIEDCYQQLSTSGSPPTNVTTWAIQVEHNIDLACRKTQQRDLGTPWHAAKGLPRSFRGRCKPRGPVLLPRKILTTPGRPRDFRPSAEVLRFTTLHASGKTSTENSRPPWPTQESTSSPETAFANCF